jgi:hypothetical protein
MLYCVTYTINRESEQVFIESPTFSGAIKAWARHMNEEYDVTTVEPTGIAIVSDRPVLRAE